MINAAAEVSHIGPHRPVKRGRKFPFGSTVVKMACAEKLRNVNIRNGTQSRGTVPMHVQRTAFAEDARDTSGRTTSQNPAPNSFAQSYTRELRLVSVRTPHFVKLRCMTAAGTVQENSSSSRPRRGCKLRPAKRDERFFNIHGCDSHPLKRQQRGGRIWVVAQIAFDHSYVFTLLKMCRGVALSSQGFAVKHRPRRATSTKGVSHALMPVALAHVQPHQ